VRAFRSAIHGFVAIEAADGFGMDVDVEVSFDRLLATLAQGVGEPRRAPAP
jgi:Tetracyclin repressor-like, C-terminal domain